MAEIKHFNSKPSTHAYNTWPFPQLPQASLRYKPDNIYSEFDEGGELPHCNFFYQLKCHWQRGSDAKKSHTTYYLVAWCCVGRRWPLYGRQLCHIVTYSNCSVLWLIVTWGKGRVVRATLAPSARRCSATARPIPWADPVIITTAPWVTIIIIGQWYDYHWRLK